MWFFSTQGFVSVVRNPDSNGPGDELLVRCRARADLQRFIEFVALYDGQPIAPEPPTYFYCHWLKTSRERLATFLEDQELFQRALQLERFKEEYIRNLKAAKKKREGN